MATSTWTTARGPVDREAVVVHVHGDDDDALRIVAELTAAVGDDADKQVGLSPQSSWSARRKAAARALERRLTSSPARPLVIVDPDALPSAVPRAGDARWDDRTFLLARHQLRSLLLNHAASTEGVTFVRPRPERQLTSDLGAVGVLASEESDEPLPDIMPFARPLARGLIQRGTITEHSLSHWVQTLEEPELSQLVVDAAYEALSSGARAALGRLALLRGPQALNGVAGPFTLDGERAVLSLNRSAVNELRVTGWLQPAVGRGFEVPNALRTFACTRARLTTELRPIHREIAATALPELDRAGVREAIEAHHHAIDAGDVALALETGRYFVNDLRRLAFELSTRDEAFEAAASVYRAILACDGTDAYAHEYLAYNLHRATGEPSDEVLEHYDRARLLERDNPLFTGRWLACRVSRGENVTTELKKYIRRFNQQLGPEAVSYLAKPPLLAMRLEQRRNVAREWGRLLERIPELRDLLG